MNTIFVVAAILAVGGALAFPSTDLEELFHLKRRQVSCQGNPSEQVVACMRPLESVDHPSSGSPMEGITTPEQLNHMCSLMENATDCVEYVHNVCHQREDMLVALTYKTMRGVVGHLCSPEGREIILAEQDCWNDESLEDEIEGCGNRQHHGPPCSIMDNVKRCIVNAVDNNPNCSDRATMFMDELLAKALQPMAEAMNCGLQQRVSRALLKAFPLRRK